jgi:hypothetical protein
MLYVLFESSFMIVLAYCLLKFQRQVVVIVNIVKYAEEISVPVKLFLLKTLSAVSNLIKLRSS